MFDKVYAVKELLGEHKPYSVRIGIDGVKGILVNKHFVSCIISAIDKGCTARMGTAEKKFWDGFVKYQKDVQDGTRDDFDMTTATEYDKELESAYVAVSTWIVDEIAGNGHPHVGECYTVGYEVK